MGRTGLTRFVASASVLLGALTALRAEDAAILTAPGELLAGGESSVALVTLDSRNRQPLQVPVFLELTGDQGEPLTLFEGTSGPDGQVSVRFQVPAVEPGQYRIRATVGKELVLEATTRIQSTPALLIETDKPVYRPGQTIQGRVVRLTNDLRPSAGPVVVTLFDGKGIRVARENLVADQYGVAAFSLKLASEVNKGVWKVRARSEDVESSRDLRIENYVLPRFDLDLTFEKRWALVSEPISGQVRADYFYGRPVEGEVRLIGSRWIGVWEEYTQVEGQLSEGLLDFELPAPGFVTGTPQNGGQGAVRLDVEVVDSTGHAQKVTDSIVISKAPVVLAVLGSSERIKGGLPFGIYILSKSPDGTAVETTVEYSVHFYDGAGVELKRETGTAQTENGLVARSFVAPLQTSFADIIASSSLGGDPTSIRLAGTFSPSESFLSLIRTDGEGPASVGQVLSFEVLSTISGTTYYEVFGSGRTVFSDYTEGGTFSFPVTADMVPAARVIAYRVTSSNEVVADSHAFETELSISAHVEAGFGVAQARPGDPVDVVIDTGMGRRALLGVSIVDQSVLALGRSRLHLEQVFQDLEERFLRPVVEVHEDANPLPQFMGVPFFEPVPLIASEEIFHEAGLVVATTPNLSVPRGRNLDFEDAINLSPPPSTEGGKAADQPRLRQFFPETWLWNPMLLTDEQGKATLQLKVPDSITGWQLSVVATQPDSQPGLPGIAFGEAELRAFQDFFVEPDLPFSVVRGEVFPVKVDVFNYLSQAQQVELSLEKSTGFEILGGSSRTLTVPGESATSVELPIQPTRVGEFPLQITALGSEHSDAVLRPIRVIPEGFPTEEVFNGVLKAGETEFAELRVLEGVVKDSVRNLLSLTPSPVAQTMKGVSDLLGMPYGCGEQNMIFLAPDIEILKYLREIGELSPETRAEAENYINVGYQRQLTFQTADGGFAAFGGDAGSLWLTAFVLSTFSGAREIRDIDESVLTQAAGMLVSRQRDNGSFELDEFLIHTEMAGGVANEYTMAAYVTHALADYGGAETLAALQHAASYLEINRELDEVRRNPYPLAIAAVALQKVAGYGPVADSILDNLIQLAITDSDGIHWEPFPVETTGYVATALLTAGQGSGRPEAQAALDWLTTQRNSLGGYGTSTQDTVVALRALFLSAQKTHREIDLDVEVLLGSEPLFSFHLNQENFDLLHQVPLPAEAGVLSLRASGTGTVGYQVASRYNLPGHLLPPPRDLRFEVEYETDHVEVDEMIDVLVSLTYSGTKERTGMVIADVGIPTGFQVVGDSLDELVREKAVERVEQAGRKIIFYIDHLNREIELSFSFQLRALYPVRASDTVGHAYEYYDQSIRAFEVLEALEIVNKETETPVVESVSREAGSGGTQFIIYGHGFDSGVLAVLFGGVAARDFTVLHDGAILVTIPNVIPGKVQIELLTRGGRATYDGNGFVVSPFRLYYPYYATESGGFTGYAFSNLSERDAVLGLSVYDTEGRLEKLPGNPRTLRLEPGKQEAKLETELFERTETSVPSSGWIEMVSDNTEVGSLFQFGDLSRLDGAVPSSEAGKELWFTRVFQGPTAYRGLPAVTWLTVINTSSEQVVFRLELIDGTKSEIAGESRLYTIPSKGCLVASAAEIFQMDDIPRNSFLKVKVADGEGITGFIRIELLSRETDIGLPAITHGASKFWSAQIAGGPKVFTNLKLINTSGEARQLTLQAWSETGEKLATEQSFGLQPHEAIERDIYDLLPGLRPGSEASYMVGSLSGWADGDGIIGDVLFGDPENSENAAALALQSEPFRGAVFSHAGDTETFFTGIAVQNPGAESSDVLIQLYSRNGSLIGEAALTVGVKARFSREIRELIPGIQGQPGGYLVVTASRPVVAQLLFGSRALTMLSAVPPTILE